ncbi:MAG: 3'(2'),5'-bisphosphate nucleotidase CysQ [Bdellovibrionales bacterium]|nr:3'(2'),5'-bisphosphate nucleotidase CysQ [Bdellovibrionales bacterium]
MFTELFFKEANGIVKDAGRLLARLAQDPTYRQPVKKPDGSPVTKADLEVNGVLVEALLKLGVPVVSEESLPEKPPGKSDTYFIVDPLDGTKYFARGEDEFAICVGLLKDGDPLYGAIHDPSRGLLYWGVKERGAFLEDKKITHPGVGDKLKVYSSGFHAKPARKWLFDSLPIGEIREKGSALKFCDLAKGEVDLYLRFGPTSEWDTAAAQVILEEAHCLLLEAWTGEPMTYGKPDYLNRGIIACHESLRDPLVKLLEEHWWPTLDRNQETPYG